MSRIHSVAGRKPQLAYSDFDFVRLVVGFIGDLANSLNAVLTFVQNLLTFLG